MQPVKKSPARPTLPQEQVQHTTSTALAKQPGAPRLRSVQFSNDVSVIGADTKTVQVLVDDKDSRSDPDSFRLNRRPRQPRHRQGDLAAALQTFSAWNSTAPDHADSCIIAGHTLQIGPQRLDVARQLAKAGPAYAQFTDQLSLLRSSRPAVLSCAAAVRLVVPLLGVRHEPGKTITEVLYGIQLDPEATDADRLHLASLAEQVTPATPTQQAIYFLRRHHLRADNDWDEPGGDAKAPPTESSQPLLPPSGTRSDSVTPPTRRPADPDEDAPGESACCLIL